MKGLVNEDWEMEFSKNLVYLQEDIEELKNEIYPLMNQKDTAQIVVIDEDDILESLKHGRKNRTISSERTAEELSNT
jgi:hypothetical protein